MARPLKEIEQELLLLPQNERAQLAHCLIVSLDEGMDEDVDAYWREELERRNCEIENGAVELIPADEAMRRAREALKK